MAYNGEKLTKLQSLKDLALRIRTDFATKQSVNELSEQVNNLVSTGGEPNVITAVKVNGEAQTITDKAVDLTVPTKLSELTNDSGFQSVSEVNAAIQTAISASGHAAFEKVDTVPTVDAAEDNMLYLVMNSGTGHYDIYAKVGEEVVLLDDTTVDLTGYVEKEEGKGLSDNNFTDALKTKLEGVPEVAADTEVAEMLTEVFGAAV